MAEISKAAKGVELIEYRSWHEGLSMIWDEIDSGNEDARVELAQVFDNYNLHSFSQDQWMYLLENGSTDALRERGAQGVALNYLWLPDYANATSVTSSFAGLEWVRDHIVEKETENELSDPAYLSGAASHFLGQEQQLLRKLEENFNRDDQLDLILIRDSIATCSTVAARSHAQSLRDVAVVTALGLSRPASEALPAPEDAWSQMAHACALLIGYLVDDAGHEQDERFHHVCKLGRISLGKMFLLRGSHDIANDEELFAVTNIGAGSQIAGNFGGFILSGLTAE